MRVKRQPRFAQTDVGNAEMFAWSSNDDLRYDYKRGRWLVWRGHWWSEDSDELVMRRAKSVARMRAQAAQSLPEEEKKRELSWAFQSESRPRLEAMLRLGRSESPLCDSGDGWDCDPWLLGTANGVVDLRTGNHGEGSPTDKITLHSDVPFDSSAQSPRWEQFLSEIFDGEQSLIEFVHRAMGYCLTGDTSEQCVFLCYGAGANGKTTFLEVARHVLGTYSYNLPFSSFELKARASIPNDVAALVGRRYVTAVETNESAELNEARIKALTGGDEVTARFFHREFFGFRPMAKFWLAFNHKPQVADDSEGFWRRVRVIPFLKQFAADRADKNLLAALKAEAPGILAWMVRGCLKWQSEGLGAPASVIQATEQYKEESDPLADFLVERCIIAPSASVTAALLFTDYQEWASTNGEIFPPLRRGFTRRLESKGFKKTRRGHDRIWTWEGLSLRTGSSSPGYYGPGVIPRADADVNSDIVLK